MVVTVLRAIVAISFFVALPVGATQTPMTAARARKLMQPPPGSLSVGKTSGGRLLGGVKIPLTGQDYAFFEHIAERGTYYGTEEMKRLLPRLGAAVRRDVRGSPRLRVGNVSLQHGGRSQWHVSHQAGRDVDLCFYALDRQSNKPVELDNFRKFGWRGISRDGAYAFDARRNMQLVRAMLTDEHVGVQWIFVARWLKRRIIAEAVRAGISEAVRHRMNEVMRQPSDSARHDDHFHVRIYCSTEDRKFGCVTRDPLREWVDLGEQDFQAHVGELSKVLDLPIPALRLRAISSLQRINAASASGAVAERLLDRDRRVRQAALMALMSIAAPESGAAILAQLGRIEDANWARSVFSLYRHVAPPELLQIADLVVRAPQTVLHAKVRATALPRFYIAAAEILADRGRKQAVPTLLKLVASRTPAVRQAGHQALLQVTNQRVGARQGAAAWPAFWQANKGATWLAWMRRGFASWGIKVRSGTGPSGEVPTLIAALRHRNSVVRRNAERTLTALTGHEISDGYRQKLRSQRDVARHWKYWWRRNRRKFQQRDVASRS